MAGTPRSVSEFEMADALPFLEKIRATARNGTTQAKDFYDREATKSARSKVNEYKQ